MDVVAVVTLLVLAAILVAVLVVTQIVQLCRERDRWRARALLAEHEYVAGEQVEDALQARVDELEERERVRAEDRLTPEQARDLLAEVDLPELFPGVRGGRATVFDTQKCQHCQGIHTRKCPALSEIEFYETGKVKRTRFFPHGHWPEDQVLWLEDVYEAAGEVSAEG